MILTGLTITSLFLTIIFGIQYRMIKQPLARKIGQAIMNMFMGSTLVLFAINQLLIDTSTTRMAIAILLFILGLFNILMGVKNYRFYKKTS